MPLTLEEKQLFGRLRPLWFGEEQLDLLADHDFTKHELLYLKRPANLKRLHEEVINMQVNDLMLNLREAAEGMLREWRKEEMAKITWFLDADSPSLFTTFFDERSHK